MTPMLAPQSTAKHPSPCARRRQFSSSLPTAISLKGREPVIRRRKPTPSMNEPSEYLGPGRLSWLADFAPYLPPAFGALMGLRWARHQTATQKVTSFGLSFGLGVYLGPAVAEILSLGPKAAVAAGIL